MPSTTTYTWDEENRLTNITLPNGSNEDYFYAADGLRRSKSANGQTTRFVWDAENLLQEQRDSQTIAHYTNQPNGYGPLLSQRRSDGENTSDAQFNAVSFGGSAFNQSGNTFTTPASSFYGFDLSVNTRILTDGSGNISDQYTNTAFGKPISRSGNTINSYRFGGKVGYYQDNNDRSYVRARHYSTNQGRWISRDPIGFHAGDWNSYRYASNNAINRIDPSGLVANCTDQNPCCGPEVKTLLGNVLRAVGNRFHGWSDDEKAKRCISLTHPETFLGAWDVTQLHTGKRDQGRPGYHYMIQPFQAYKCGIGRCWETVMVDGQCHKSSHVNYALFGVMFRLCHDYYPIKKAHSLPQYWALQLARGAHGAIIVDMEYSEKDIKDMAFSKSWMVDIINGWQLSNYLKLFGSTGSAYKLSSADSKGMWAVNGYNRGAYGRAIPPKARFTNCGKCCHPASLYENRNVSPFEVHWGDATSDKIFAN